MGEKEGEKEKELTQGLEARVGYTQDFSGPSQVVLGFGVWIWGVEFASVVDCGLLKHVIVSSLFFSENLGLVSGGIYVEMELFHLEKLVFVVSGGAISERVVEEFGEVLWALKGWWQTLRMSSNV